MTVGTQQVEVELGERGFGEEVIASGEALLILSLNDSRTVLSSCYRGFPLR